MSQLTIEQAFQIAAKHHQAGRLAVAESIYRKVLALQPKHPDALLRLGTIASQVGHREEALAFYQMALDIKPDFSEAFHNMGTTFNEMGQLDRVLPAGRETRARFSRGAQ